MSNVSRWRVAARLARREVRRHWARSALVVLIIALPVLATQAAAITWRVDAACRVPDIAVAPEVQRLAPQAAGSDQLRLGSAPRSATDPGRRRPRRDRVPLP